MREIRQSGSEGGGNEQTVSPYPYPMSARIMSLFGNQSRGLGNASSFASLSKSDPQAAPALTMIPDETVSDAGNGTTEGAGTL